MCIIILHTALTVQFSQSNYTSSESSGIVPVTLSLSGGVSASKITVTVIASDQLPVSAKGKSRSNNIMIKDILTLIMLQEALIIFLDHILSQFLLKKMMLHLIFQ